MGESTVENLQQAEDLVRQAVQRAAHGETAEATELLEKAIDLKEDQPVGRLHLALCLSAAGRYDEARSHIERALELRGDSAAFQLFAGRVCFDAQNYPAARSALRRAIELNSENDLAAGYLALTDWADGDAEAAARLAPDCLPDSTPFFARLLMLIEADMRGRPAEYVRPNCVAPFIDRMRILFELWMAGREAKAGHFDRAAMRAQMVQEIQPGHPAGAALQRECQTSALEAARRRVEEEPEAAEARVELANHLADNEDYTGAQAEIRETERIVGEDDDALLKDPMVLRLRGRIAYGLGQVDEAAALIEQGAEPGFAMTEVNYYRGLCALGQDRRSDCVAAFEALVSKVCWAVPMRLREHRAWRSRSAARAVSEARTSP